METIKEHQMEMLELKAIGSEKKNSFDEFRNRPDMLEEST